MCRLQDAARGFALLVVAGCGANMIVVNGLKVRENAWNEAVSDLERRAVFDLDCAPEKTEFELRERRDGVPTEVSVLGCDKRGTYLREVGRGGVGAWALGMERGQANEDRVTPPPPPPPAPAPEPELVPVEPPPVPP